jgi:hypothetical protein
VPGSHLLADGPALAFADSFAFDRYVTVQSDPDAATWLPPGATLKARSTFAPPGSAS